MCLNTSPALELTLPINVLAAHCEECNDQPEKDYAEYYYISCPVIELVDVWSDLSFELGVKALHRVEGCRQIVGELELGSPSAS